MRPIRLFFLITIICGMLFGFASAGACGSNFNLPALKAQAAKVVPSDFETVTEEADDMSAFAAYKKGEQGFQFTLSTDMDPQFPGSASFTYKGKKAYFFTPGLDSSGAVMVIIKPEAVSLTVVYSAGYSTDKDVTKEDMVKLLDKMDLNAL